MILYNHVFLLPTIGMVGILEKKNDFMTLDFKSHGDLIYLIGPSKDDISSSGIIFNIVIYLLKIARLLF